MHVIHNGSTIRDSGTFHVWRTSRVPSSAPACLCTGAGLLPQSLLVFLSRNGFQDLSWKSEAYSWKFVRPYVRTCVLLSTFS